MPEPIIHLDLQGDGAWSDLNEEGRTVIDAGSTLRMTTLPDGMSSGRPSIALRIDLHDDNGFPVTVIAQTSLRALRATMAALDAHYGGREDL